MKNEASGSDDEKLDSQSPNKIQVLGTQLKKSEFVEAPKMILYGKSFSSDEIKSIDNFFSEYSE